MLERLKGRKVKHRLNSRVGIIVGFTHYSRRDRDGEFEIKWLQDDGSIRLGRAYPCEVEFLEDDQ